MSYKIPDDFMLSVFKKLRIRDLLRVRLVCRKWAAIVSDVIVLQRKDGLVLSNTTLNDQHPFVQTFAHSPYNIWAWTKIRFFNVVFEESEMVTRLYSIIGPNIERLQIIFRTNVLRKNELNIRHMNQKWITLLKHTPNLIELEIRSELQAPNFSGPEKVSSDFNLPKLEKATVFCHDARLNAYITKILTKGANRLSSIDFYGGTKLEFDTLYFLIELQKHSLKELKISGDSVEMEHLHKYFAIDNMSLEVLNINLELDTQSLNLLGNHKNLRELRSSTKSRENLQEYPSFLMNLEKLEIEVYSRDCNILFPKNFNNIKSLKVITHLEEEGGEGPLISFETPTYQSNLSVLELLSYEWVRISSVSMRSFIDNFPNLGVLKLDRSSCDWSIIPIIADKLVHLEELHLLICVKNPSFERNAFLNISNLRKLRVLWVGDYIHICNDRFFLQHLRLPALKDLKMWMNSNSSRARHVTDRGICGLIMNCPLLRSISLTNLDAVTEACLYKISNNLIHLQSLTILGKLITKAQCNRVNNTLPKRKLLLKMYNRQTLTLDVCDCRTFH